MNPLITSIAMIEQGRITAQQITGCDEKEEHMYLDYRFGQIRQQEILEAAANARERKLTWEKVWPLRDWFVALSRRITRTPRPAVRPQTMPSSTSIDCC